MPINHYPVRILKYLIIILISLIILVSYPFIEPYLIQINVTEITDNDVPAAFKDLKIIFIADFHYNRLLHKAYFELVINYINRLQPDLILLGGDYTDADTENIDKCFSLLARLDAPLGKYAVLGNHDNWYSGERVINGLKQAGIKLVNNSGFWITKRNEKMYICGVGDYYTDTQLLDRSLDGIKQDDYCILISHTPDYVHKIMENKPIDLVLCGHTHGGQVTFFGFHPFVLPLYDDTYWKGYHQLNNFDLLITNGVGVYRYPVRFFARPTIEVLIL